MNTLKHCCVINLLEKIRLLQGVSYDTFWGQNKMHESGRSIYFSSLVLFVVLMCPYTLV